MIYILVCARPRSATISTAWPVHLRLAQHLLVEGSLRLFLGPEILQSAALFIAINLSPSSTVTHATVDSALTPIALSESFGQIGQVGRLHLDRLTAEVDKQRRTAERTPTRHVMTHWSDFSPSWADLRNMYLIAVHTDTI